MSTKNVILTDKNGEQIAPATITDAVAYDNETTLTEKIDELIALASIIDIDSVNIVADLPVNLVNNAMYLIPIIDRFIPSIPNGTGYDHFVICCNVANARVNEAFKGATEFYLYCGDYLKTSIVGKDTLAYTNSTSEYTSYPLCFKYTVGGAFAWEVMSVPQDWGRRQPPSHEIEHVIYASNTITSFFQNTVKYETYENVIKGDGSLIDAPIPTTFNSYYVVDGVAYRRGVSDLSYILNNLTKIVKPITITEDGTYTADNLNAYGYSPITVNTSSNVRGETKSEETKATEEKTEETKEA